MRKRFQLALVAVATAIVAVVAWEVLPPREPMYQGRPITDWIWDGYVAESKYHSSPETEQKEKAKEAVTALGTNAIPFYLNLLEIKNDSPLKEKICDLINKQPWHKFDSAGTWRYSQRLRRGCGAGALIILGTNARPAFSELTKLLKEGDGDEVANAAYVLPSMGLDGIAPLTNRIADLHAKWRSIPVLALEMYTVRKGNKLYQKPKTPEEAESAAKIIVPFLIPLLKDSNPNVQIATMGVLRDFDWKPEMVVPAIMETVEKSRNNPSIVKRVAINTVEKFGAEAKSAVPALLELTKDSDRILARDAVTALKNIDPKTAAKAEGK